MNARTRKPVVTWLLTVGTSGIYVFFWVWRVGTEFNSDAQREVLPVRKWRNAYAVLLGLTLAALLWAVQWEGKLIRLFPLLLLAALQFALFLYVQIAIGNYIKSKHKELHTGESYSHAVSLILFWLVANLGVAYMQSGINTIIAYEQKHS